MGLPLFFRVFIVNLLNCQQLTYSLVFRLAIQMTKVDPTKSSYQIMFVSMMSLSNLRYYRHFFIIKCVCPKLLSFAINLNVALSSKVFIIFDYMFISIVLLI